MPRLLVISWNARTLRYLHTDADRQGRLRVVDAGQEELTADGELSEVLVTGVQQLVGRLKADKSKLLILMNRGSVDSATFSVPPAGDFSPCGATEPSGSPLPKTHPRDR